MRGKWLGLWALGFVWTLGVGAGVPPEITDLLPQAVLLWQSEMLFPPGGPWTPVVVLAVGDLTGDGLEDIVASQSQAISLWEARPDGTLVHRLVGFYEVEWRNKTSYTVTGSVLPRAGALGDLDRNGTLDLVVATGGARPSIYLFSNEGGGLEKIGTFEIPAPPRALWVTDFTGDGVLDLLWWTANLSEEGTLYLHKGLGPFSFSGPEPVLKAKGRPFALTDIDQDGIPDLAIYTREKVAVFFGEQGRFGRHMEWAPPDGEIEDAALTVSSQGEVRLALATTKGLVLAIFSGSEFVPKISIPTEPLVRVFLFDLTEDGVEDALVQTRRGWWMVLPGDGKGGFLPPTSEFLFPNVPALRPKQAILPIILGDKPALILGSEPFPVLARVGPKPRGESTLPFEGGYLLAVGDLSGNGAPDLVVEGFEGLDVLWNAGNGAFIRRPLISEPIDPIVAVIQQGKLYLLHFVEYPTKERGVELWVLSSAGLVLARHVVERFGPDELSQVRPALCVGDLDGDGELDILTVKGSEILIWWGETVLTPCSWPGGKIAWAVCGRFTRQDLLQVALITEDGVYYASFPERSLKAFGPVLEFEGFPLSAASGDIDGDGLDDLALLGVKITTALEAQRLKIEVAGVWGELILSTRGPLKLELPELSEDDAPWPLNGLAIGDFTGDGKADLAFTTIQGAGVFVLPGRGDGRFGSGFRLAKPMGPLFAADLDGNGQEELVASSVGFNPYLWILWNGGGR